MLNTLTQKAFELAKDGSIAPVLQEQIKLVALQLEYSEKKCDELSRENAKLEVKNDALVEELSEVKLRLEKLLLTVKLIDIGPCLIKESSDGTKLPGFYCPTCKAVMERDEWPPYGLKERCPQCELMFPPEIIDEALKFYIDNKK